MKATDKLHLNSLYNVEVVCEENDAALLLIPEATVERTNLHNFIVKLEAAKAINVADLTYLAIDKMAAQIDMLTTVKKYMYRGAVKANQLNKPKIEAALNKKPTYFVSNDDATIANKAEEVKEMLKNNTTLLVNILPANITEMETKIQAYRDVLLLPQQAIDKRKTTGSMIIKELVKESLIPKNNIVKLFYSYISEQTNVINEAARIGKPQGSRHLSIAVSYTEADTGVRLKNVKTTVTNGIKTFIKYSSKRGGAQFYSLDNDNYTITSERETFITNVQTPVGVDETHVARFKIILKKESSPANDPEKTTGFYNIIVYDQETNQPLPGVQVSFPTIQYVETTDEDGENFQDTLQPATLAGTLYLDGYKQQNITLIIQAGKETKGQFYLEKE